MYDENGIAIGDYGYDWTSMAGYGGTTGATAAPVNSGGWLDSLKSIADTAIGAYATVRTVDAKSRVLEQQNAWGQRYIEGQPMRVANNGALVLSPMLLLLAGVVLFVAMKD